MEILYHDEYIAVCIKPAGVLSTDEPGGMPELLRSELKADGVFTVHRLDRVVSGLMLFALSSDCASALSRQMRERSFGKEYLAVIHWRPREPAGTFRDLLQRDPAERKTHVVKSPGKGVQEAVLDYELMASASGMSLVKIRLHTGRTHQIRAQFGARNSPLVGDGKYGSRINLKSPSLFSVVLSVIWGNKTVTYNAPPRFLTCSDSVSPLTDRIQNGANQN